jgi:hypothetical protein
MAYPVGAQTKGPGAAGPVRVLAWRQTLTGVAFILFRLDAGRAGASHAPGGRPRSPDRHWGAPWAGGPRFSGPESPRRARQVSGRATQPNNLFPCFPFRESISPRAAQPHSLPQGEGKGRLACGEGPGSNRVRRTRSRREAHEQLLCCETRGTTHGVKRRRRGEGVPGRGIVRSNRPDAARSGIAARVPPRRVPGETPRSRPGLASQNQYQARRTWPEPPCGRGRSPPQRQGARCHASTVQTWRFRPAQPWAQEPSLQREPGPQKGTGARGSGGRVCGASVPRRVRRRLSLRTATRLRRQEGLKCPAWLAQA